MLNCFHYQAFPDKNFVNIPFENLAQLLFYLYY
jgi:hypothetical protein